MIELVFFGVFFGALVIGSLVADARGPSKRGTTPGRRHRAPAALASVAIVAEGLVPLIPNGGA